MPALGRWERNQGKRQIFTGDAMKITLWGALSDASVEFLEEFSRLRSPCGGRGYMRGSHLWGSLGGRKTPI